MQCLIFNFISSVITEERFHSTHSLAESVNLTSVQLNNFSWKLTTTEVIILNKKNFDDYHKVAKSLLKYAVYDIIYRIDDLINLNRNFRDKNWRMAFWFCICKLKFMDRKKMTHSLVSNNIEIFCIIK